MNDSFLEDLDLVPKNEKRRSHITTRNATSSPLYRFTETEDFEKLLQQQKNESPKSGRKDSSITKGSQKDLEQDVRKQSTKAKVLDRKEKSTDNKLKPVENKAKPEMKEKESKVDKVIQQEVKIKPIESKVTIKERGRRSGSYKENSHFSDSFSKESNRQTDSIKDNNFQSDCKSIQRRSEIKENDPVALLNAIKDLVSTYTKQESTKVLKAMQELHINFQTTFIKTTLLQTEELIKEMHPSRDSPRMKALIDENERLREDIIILKKRNEDLHKKLEELQLIKQENISLKLKCKELSKQ